MEAAQDKVRARWLASVQVVRARGVGARGAARAARAARTAAVA